MSGSSTGRSKCVACAAITMAPMSTPRSSAATNERFISKLLSIFSRGRKGIVRSHYQVAQELIRGIHRFPVQKKAALTGIFLNQAQSELVIFEEVRAEFRHRHSFGLGTLDQPVQ